MNQAKDNTRLLIAAVVATHNRPELLANRSLPSIVRQTRPPDYLIVVDDSDTRYRQQNAETTAGVVAPRTRIMHLENRRTAGASGAWNTALAWLRSNAPDAFVAVLDDDDAWKATYLERCEAAAIQHGWDMVSAGLIRHESADGDGKRLSMPTKLAAGDFLIGNPNIQGSNLFVSLPCLLAAGGFDEALASATDRDICIRLADLGAVRYGVLAKHLVHHYAEAERSRLSTPGSEVKRRGLTEFYRKYRGRMSGDQRRQFLERSRRLFDCELIEPPPAAAQAVLPDRGPDSRAHGGRLALLVGAITSPEVGNTARLLDDLIAGFLPRDDVELKVILLENGGPEASARADLQRAVDGAAARGLEVSLIAVEQQDAGDGPRKSIAQGRTLLQGRLYTAAKSWPGAVVWILDDDCRIDDRCVNYIKQLKDMDYDVVLGAVTGAPPLPFASCIRTQLVDLYHNLELMARLSPEEPYPDRSGENAETRQSSPDYYYDLSRRGTAHLETPFWYVAASANSVTGMVFAEMAASLPGICNGIPIFRPLTIEPDLADDPLAYVAPSVNRGPTTFVFNIETLRDFPNAAPSLDGEDVRRSDMVWCLLNKYVGGRGIVQAPLPARQDRSTISAGFLDFGKLAADMRGHAFYACLHDVLRAKAEQNVLDGRADYGPELLHFNRADAAFAGERFAEYLQARLNAFELNHARILGLLGSLRRYLGDMAEPSGLWWLERDEYRSSVADLRRFVDRLQEIYDNFDIDDFSDRVRADAAAAGRIGEYLQNLPAIVREYRANVALPVDRLRERAAAFVAREFQRSNLRCLGVGNEAVALTDGERVYKYFHHWPRRQRERRIAFLESLAGQWTGFTSLYPIVEVRRDSDEFALVYPYEEGRPYAGGHLEDILNLLRECRTAGIVCRNVHPDNFIIARDRLKLVDYGADIRPYDDEGFIQMCRRAFLMYRFHFRKDLKTLMTGALQDCNRPELAGFDHFMRALAPRSKENLLDARLLDLTLSCQPETVFDYGCGAGKLADALAARGIRVTAYDIDEAVIAAGRAGPGEVHYIGPSDFPPEQKFDVVVSSLALCTIAEPAEFNRVIADLRRLVSDTGRVIVAVCNPFHTNAPASELQRRLMPAGACYDAVFTWHKEITATGRTRADVHRPLAAYRKAFLKAGLVVEQIAETDGTDTENLWPAADFLLFTLKPVPVAGPRVSLLIKTCYMEWRIIERFIRHQVSQLEGPSVFFEKVVVVDTRADGFLRQYDTPDPAAYRAAMSRLQNDGVVDRVIYAPDEERLIRETYQQWFGTEAEADDTHAANGQQIFATLYGFDACRGDYVLQIDSDLIIGRQDDAHDYLADMIEVLKNDANALFVQLPVSNSDRRHYTPGRSDGDNWRVEVRGCLFDRERLQSVRPVPNRVQGGQWQLPWHRAFDRLIAESEFRTYRGGRPETFFIHTPNDRKTDAEQLFGIIDRVEQGYVPSAQAGQVNLTGNRQEWAGPKRNEDYVFIICGRNVPPGRFRRCFDSLVGQSVSGWGAVIVDDASDNGLADYIAMLAAPYRERITLVRNNARRGLLCNTWEAVTHFCGNPDSVIITLDADDALTGRDALARVQREYDAGADATVGSMLRLDKEANYIPDFANPRSNRGGNVWQHLRTFRKGIFDAIRVDDLEIDGQWIDLASDWAFMLPIVEMAHCPVYIPDNLYLHDPATLKTDATLREREANIRRIVAMPRYPRLV